MNFGVLLNSEFCQSSYSKEILFRLSAMCSHIAPLHLEALWQFA